MEQETTLEEIEAQFVNQWVLVGDPELDGYLEVVRGTVLCHSADANEFNLTACTFYGGEIREVRSIYIGEMRFWLSGWRQTLSC